MTELKKNYSLPGFREGARDAGLRFFQNPLTLPELPGVPKNVKTFPNARKAGRPSAYAMLQIGKARIILGIFEKETLEFSVRCAAAMADAGQVYFEAYRSKRYNVRDFGGLNCGSYDMAKHLLTEEPGLGLYLQEVEVKLRSFGVQSRVEREATREAHLVHAPNLRQELILACNKINEFFEGQAPRINALLAAIEQSQKALDSAAVRLDAHRQTVCEIHDMIAKRITPTGLDSDTRRRILAGINDSLRQYGQPSVPLEVATEIVAAVLSR